MIFRVDSGSWTFDTRDSHWILKRVRCLDVLEEGNWAIVGNEELCVEPID